MRIGKIKILNSILTGQTRFKWVEPCQCNVKQRGVSRALEIF